MCCRKRNLGLNIGFGFRKGGKRKKVGTCKKQVRIEVVRGELGKKGQKMGRNMYIISNGMSKCVG